ncbi:HCNGP domain-containing protein [Cephalotus follicularis]|uniref:HCNGP domain-containing protein n=1 Tax=Cephalotus follicularis TaxID=3775 RepID=A0A1Q3D907_CEPFO|nr:HCNGP domain-containing protein [Cephalotus follicularis]
MASKKKQAEGIALLSMYNDEDDEELEDLLEQDQHRQQQHLEQVLVQQEVDEQQQQQELKENYKNLPNDMEEDSRVDDDVAATTPPIPNQNWTPLDSRSPFFSPKQQQQQQQLSSTSRGGGGRFTIVDYGHDELAMSPEPELQEGEIGSSGRVVFGTDLQTGNGDTQETTPLGTVQVLTPSIQATPQSSEHFDLSQPDTMNCDVTESETAVAEDAANVSVADVDLLDKFLPPPPKEKCPEEVQKKIQKFLHLKKIGKSFNAEVRNRKDYRNPDFLLHAVKYQDIDQIGSCFSKDVYDPYGYDKSDYYDEIEADMKREKERKEQELKKSPKVEFVSIGTQPGTVAGAAKYNVPIPGVSAVAAGGLSSVPTAADVARDGWQSKKSKWDKVDTDRRNPLQSGGQDSGFTAGTHAALMSAANAGGGYLAFAQQRRREAEERRSSELKLDRRS